jgi:hypothetical protein
MVPKESAGAAVRLPHTSEGRSSNAKLRGGWAAYVAEGHKAGSSRQYRDAPLADDEVAPLWLGGCAERAGTAVSGWPRYC